MDALERELSELDEKLALDGARAMAVNGARSRGGAVSGTTSPRGTVRGERADRLTRREISPKKEREIFDFLATSNIIVTALR